MNDDDDDDNGWAQCKAAIIILFNQLRIEERLGGWLINSQKPRRTLARKPIQGHKSS